MTAAVLEAKRRRTAFGRPETLLIIYVAILVLVPSNYTVLESLGDVGRPAVVYGFGLLIVWMFSFLFGSRWPVSATPVRVIVIFYLAVWSFTLGLAYLRGLTELEYSGSERFFLSLLSYVGVALAMSELMQSRRSIDRVLRSLVVVGAAMGVVGILQFYTDVDLVRIVRLPLPLNNEISEGLATRGSGDLTRAASTMRHSIEFSVVSAMIFPIALHYALVGRDRPHALRRWTLVALCGAGVPLAVARSGIIAIIVVLLVIFRPWRPVIRRRALVVSVVTVLLVRLTTPGLVGTIVAFFTNTSTDNSVEGRTKDYGQVWELFSARPWFGLGAGTFRPEQYFVVDNYILITAVSSGVIGLVALFVLFLGSYSVAIRVGRESPSASARSLAFALGAAILAGLATSLTFDSLDFPGFAGLFYLIVGAAGALWVRRFDLSEQDESMEAIIREPSELRPLLARVDEVARSPQPLRADVDATDT